MAEIKKHPECDNFVTTAELANVIGIAPRTVRKWVQSGILPEPIRITQRTVRHNLSKALARLEAQKKTSERKELAQ